MIYFRRSCKCKVEDPVGRWCYFNCNIIMEPRVLLTVLIAITLTAGRTSYVAGSKNQFYRTYECAKDNYCQRTSQPIVTIDPDHLKAKHEHTTLESCRLVCGRAAGLWPIPTGTTTFGKSYVRIDPLQIHFGTSDLPVSSQSYISEICAIFMSNLQLTCGSTCERINSTMTIVINVKSEDNELNWNTNESYNLQIVAKASNVVATIEADTIYGARHALETLSQLIVRVITPDGGSGLVILDNASILDSPAYPHRGLLIDTARNFLPINDILRTIDALGSTKMNVLHWHATDSQSFPLQIKSRPLMALYGAYSAEKTYSPEDLGRVALYAKLRGVRVILELDTPSHVGAGWDWGPSEGLGDIAVCVNEQPWRNYCVQPPCGQINPVNPNTYDVLRDIYRDVLGIIGAKSVIHVGGDEVFINCWNSTPAITDVMQSRGMGRTESDFLQLWANFHNEQKRILDEVRGGSNESLILWTSALTTPGVVNRYLNANRFVIQTWVEDSSTIPYDLLGLGYRIIVSTKNAWYLDHGFWGSTRYHTWRDAYNNRIPRVPGVLGGEACMWGEYVNGGGLDSRVWPRAAAVAERLWSDPKDIATIDAEPRLQSHKMRLESRGIFADALTPEWCNQHDRMCT